MHAVNISVNTVHQIEAAVLGTRSHVGESTQLRHEQMALEGEVRNAIDFESVCWSAAENIEMVLETRYAPDRLDLLSVERAWAAVLQVSNISKTKTDS